MKDLISIVIPVYNVEKYLKECVDSAINQTYKNLEIILVDDGAKDNCPKICDEYKEKDNRIKVIHKKNGGLSDARNAGIEIATGKYITFIDSDDYMNLEMIEKLYENIVKYNADISVCNYCLTSRAQKTRIDNRENLVLELDKKLYIENTYSHNSFGFAVWNKLFKKEIFDNIRFPVGKTCEDMYTFPQILEKTNKYVYTTDVLYNYRQRNGSITKGKIKYHSVLASSYNKKYMKLNYPQSYSNACAQHIFDCMAIYNKLIYMQGNKLKKSFLKKSIKNDLNIIGKDKSKYFSKMKIIQVYVLLYCSFAYKLIFNMKTKERKQDFFD